MSLRQLTVTPFRSKTKGREIEKGWGRRWKNIRANIKARLRSRTNRRQRHEHNEIPGHPMVFIHLLRVLLAAEQRGDPELRDPDYRLQEEEDVGDQA